MDRKERALIEKAQEGNAMAFEQLIRRYDKQVLSLAYSMVNNTEDAKDIYQEVFIRVYRGLRKFKKQSEFSTWLHRITVNYAINFRKKRTKYKMFTAPLEDDAAAHWRFADASDVGEDVGYSELKEKLDEILDTLSPQQRSVFVLRHYHGYKLREVAEILQCNLGTVKNYLYRATQKVQQQLSGYIEE